MTPTEKLLVSVLNRFDSFGCALYFRVESISPEHITYINYSNQSFVINIDAENC